MLRLLDLRRPSSSLAAHRPPTLGQDQETNPNTAAWSPGGRQIVVSYDLLHLTDKNIYLYSVGAEEGSPPEKVGVLPSCDVGLDVQ